MELLIVKNLSKKYKAIQAVDNISFAVNKGEVLGLLGPNGAGKSTTISMISTLLKPDQGEIFYKDKEIIKNPKEIQKNLGYVPQEIALYPMLTGKENMDFWGRAYGLKGDDLKASIEEVSEIIGIKERLSDKVKNYSGGMKRRLNIGVALLHRPELIIMDEPTVGIDPQSRKHILDTVLDLNKKGITVIYTSHYMEEVEYLCNRICIMDKGKIIAEGTKEELLKNLDEKRDIHLKLERIDEEIMGAISKLEGVKTVKKENDHIVITVIFSNNIFKKLIEEITNQGGNIISIDIQEPNLESVFLKLTGRELRD